MAVGSTARKPVGQQTAYIRKRLTRAAQGTSATLSIGKIPAGSNIIRAQTMTRVAADGTTPVYSLGVSGSTASIAASAANGLATLGFTNVAIAAGAGSVPDTDIEVLATYSVTGGTVGTSDIQVEFIPPDETP